MQVNSVVNSQFVQKKQIFKGKPADSVIDTKISNQTYQSIPMETSQAYISPQITQGYKELETFEVPYVGKGKIYELSNGHKIILVPKAGPTVIKTYVGAGNLNEPGNLKQTSHLLEHLVDNNCSAALNKEVQEILDRTGAEYNASTSNYFTEYHLNAPITKTEDLDDLIKVQAKTLQNKNFSDKDIEDEKAIILQELDSKNYFTNDRLLIEKITLQNLFNLENSSDIITPPSISSINNIKKEDLINYYNTFYQPKNMTTVIVGSVDDNTIKAVAKYIGSIQATQQPIIKIKYPKIPTDNLIQKTVRKDVQSLDKDSDLANIDLSFIGPKTRDTEDSIKLVALKKVFMNRIIDDMDKHENNEDSLFCSITTETISSDKNIPNILRVWGFCKNFETEKNLNTIYAKLYDLVQNPISDEELAIMKKDLNSKITIGKESASFLSNALGNIGLMSGCLDETKILKYINELTVEDIQNVAQKYIDLNKASITVIHPYKTTFDKVKNPNEISFKGNIDQLNSKDIHEYVLPNNLRVVIDSRPGIVNSSVIFDLHSKKTLYNNPEAGPSMSALISSKNTEINLRKEGIILDIVGGPQQIYSELYGDSSKALEMLGYAAGILLNPDFSPEQFEKTKSKILESQRNPFNENNKKIISKEIGDELFKESPYHYVEGSVKDLTLEDVKNLHQQILQNAQGAVFITIPKDKLKEMKGEIFKTLMKVPTLQPYDYNTIFNKVDFKPLDKTKIFIKTKDDTQVEVSQIFKIIESGNIKDRAGLFVLNEKLGGSDKSLLFKQLRDNDKISYGAYSDYVISLPIRKVSKIELGTTVMASKENLHKVVNEYKNCINELISQPISDEELKKIKIKLKNNMLYEIESSYGKNESVYNGYNSFYGLNYQEALMDAIDKMTPEYVQELAKYYFTQPSLISVIGNKEVIEGEQNYLANLGEIIECD